MKQAKWIWIDREIKRDCYARFYQTFSANGGTVTIALSCDSNYELYVNGQLAGFGQYADYPYDKVYDSIDLTPYCRVGENRMALLVWYCGNDDSFTYYKGRPGLIYEVTEDGETVAFSDRRTLCEKADDYVSGREKTITGQLGYSFTYDTRNDNGWRSGDFCPRGAGHATELDDGPNALRARPIEKLRLLPYAPARAVAGAPHIYDLGRETVGYFFVRLRAPAGAVVTVSWGEHLITKDGVRCVPRKIGSRDFSLELIGNGQKITFANYMRRLGLRYLQVSGCDETEVEQIGVYPAEYPLAPRPFRATTPQRQHIYDTAVHTLRCCMHEHYEDCPWREQALYNMDSRNQMLCTYAAFGDFRFARASLELMGNDRREDGLLHICFPSSVDLVIPFFSLFWIVQMREYAEAAEDDSFILRFYEKMKTLLAVFLAKEENGLIVNFYGEGRYWNFYEWNETLNGHPNPAEKSFDLMLNATCSLALQSMATMAARVGKREDAECFRKRAERLNGEINRAFYVPQTGLYKTALQKDGYAELGNAFAVLCGAANGRAAAHICEQIAGREGMIPATLSMKAFTYDAMLETDRERYRAWILNDIDRTYAKMLAAGATSFWETEEGEAAFHCAGSLCHGWSAMPIVYYRKLDG